MNARGIDFTGIAYLSAIVLAAILAYTVWKKGGAVFTSATAAAGAIADAVNPANPNNAFATVANTITQAVTGDSSTSLGSSLYDLGVKFGLNPDAGAIAIAPTFTGGGGAMKTTGATGEW